MNSDLDFLALKEISTDLPFCVYWKNTCGSYAGVNPFGIQILEMTEVQSSIIGKTDFAIFDTRSASQFRQNDSKVISSRAKQISIETTSMKKQKRNKLILLSIKKPLIEYNNEVIGILGISYPLSCFLIDKNRVFLSPRQIDTLSCLQAGMTAKMTARFLGISPKTAESHTESIKNKFSCNTLAEILSVVHTNGATSGLTHYFNFLNAALLNATSPTTDRYSATDNLII